MITIEPFNKIAELSPDHICPVGCINDNFTSYGLINEVLNYFNNAPISMVDLGCAGGQFVADFISRGCTGIGLEGSSHALFGAGNHNWKKYFNKNLFLCDLTAPFQLYQDGQPLLLDFIHSSEVLEHIHETQLDTVFENVKKHLKPTGICCFQISLVDDIRIVDGEQIILHQSVFPAEWWKEKLESHGFSFDVRENSLNDNIHFGYIFNNKFRNHGGSVFIVCRLK